PGYLGLPVPGVADDAQGDKILGPAFRRKRRLLQDWNRPTIVPVNEIFRIGDWLYGDRSSQDQESNRGMCERGWSLGSDPQFHLPISDWIVLPSFRTGARRETSFAANPRSSVPA